MLWMIDVLSFSTDPGTDIFASTFGTATTSVTTWLPELKSISEIFLNIQSYLELCSVWCY